MPEIAARLSTALADRYKIERRLGEGGMATVYLAEDLKHDRKVALKVLKPELAAVLGAERFVQEIKTTAALQHPHILPLFDSGTAGKTDGGTPFLYYVMPFVEGETLRDKLDREKQLGIDDAVRITVDVAGVTGRPAVSVCDSGDRRFGVRRPRARSELPRRTGRDLPEVIAGRATLASEPSRRSRPATA